MNLTGNFIRIFDKVINLDEIVAVDFNKGESFWDLIIYLRGGGVIKTGASFNSDRAKVLENFWRFLSMDIEEIDFKYHLPDE